MGGNIPGGNFLDGNFPGGNFPGESLMGGEIFRVGIFPGGVFLEPKILCRRFHIKTPFTFRDMHRWGIWKVCLQTFKKNRIC